ncbi:PEP-CTERM sorting domain-containing protein [Niveibacterium sp. SC-1]|uniref:PEP-CTERM sorting domain-containing protein n=1 Tax=Niveibacterium sp. SC-1 TaxID=3135646 RepID=UPI00311EE442
MTTPSTRPARGRRPATLAATLCCLVSLAALVHSNTALAHPLGSLSSLDSAYGAGTLTRDSATGLEWLDLSLSAGYSYSTVLSHFDGFSIATGAQVSTLMNHSGAPAAPHGAAAQSAFDALTDLLAPVKIDDLADLGCTLALQGLADEAVSGGHTVAGIGLDRTPAGPNGCGPVVLGSEFITFGPVASGLSIDDATTIGNHNLASGISVGGIFLVRETTVPAPGTLALLVAGCLATLGARRRSR